MIVHQILKGKASQEIVTVQSTATVFEAAKILSEKRIGSILVSDDGKTALGILSERDIVRNLGRVGNSCLEGKVADYMTRNLTTCTLQTRAQDLLQKMTEGRFRHVPVVENGEVVGLVSIGDVVKAQLSELEMEKEALEGMIMGH